MNGNMYVGGNNTASDYGDYDQEVEDGAEERSPCCEHSTQVDTGSYRAPVDGGGGGGGYQGEGGHEGSSSGDAAVPPPGSGFDGGAPIVSDAQGNLYVQAIDGNLYPIDMSAEGGEAVSGEGGTGEGGSVAADPTTGLLAEVDGVVVPLTPELAREIGGEQIRSMALDGLLEPARVERLLEDPAALEVIGVVVQTANEVSGGSIGFAERAVEALVSNEAGHADRFISRMLGDHLNGTGEGIGVADFVKLANDGAFLADLESMLQPEADGMVPAVRVDLATDKVLLEVDPDRAAVEPLPSPGSGDDTADEAAATAPGTAIDITPEEATEIGASYLRSLAGKEQILAPDGQPSAEREAMVMSESDPTTLQAIGVVYETAFQMSGGDEAYATRAAEVFVTDVGTSLGQADRFVSQMLRESLASGGDFSVEQFVELAHDGEFLGELLALLQPGEDGAVPPENLQQAQKLFDDRTGVGSGTSTEAEDGAIDTPTESTQTESAANVDGTASGSGEPIVERYFTALVDTGRMTGEEARVLMGDEGFMAALQPFLAVDDQGMLVNPQGALKLADDAVEVLRNEGTSLSGADGEEAVAGGEEVAQGENAGAPDGAALAARYLEEGNGRFRDLMIGQGVTGEDADEALVSLAGDEEYVSQLAALLAPVGQGQLTPEAANEVMKEAFALTVQNLREKVGEIVGAGGDGSNEGASESQTAEQQQQEAQQFVEGGGQVGDFLGLGEGQGELIGGGAYDAYDGLFGENTDFAQGGAGIDQVADGFGLDTNGAFQGAGNIYEGAETIFDGDSSTGDIVNGAFQLGVGGYEFGKSIGLWGGNGDGDDDSANFDGDFAGYDVETPAFDTNGEAYIAEGYDLDGSFETDTDFSNDIDIDTDSYIDTDYQLDTSLNTDMTDFEITEDTEFSFAS